MARRRCQIGDAAIWTDYADGTRHKTTILAHIEPDPDDDYDEAAHGPLYLATIRGHETQVAEEDLSPWPRPSLSAVRDASAGDKEPGDSAETGGCSHEEGEAMSDQPPGEPGQARDIILHVAPGSPGQALTDDRIREIWLALSPLVLAASDTLSELGVTMQPFPTTEAWRDDETGHVSFALTLTADGERACWQDDCSHLDSAEQD